MRKIALLFIIATILSCAPSRQISKTENLQPKVHCSGVGKHTIVMDAGMGNWSIFYHSVIRRLEEKYKVCSIDRAGYASTAVTQKVRDAKTIAYEMNEVLTENGIGENIILVGHSLGGLHIRMFQNLFPEKVKALIMIDAAHPEQFNRLPKQFTRLKVKQLESLDKVIALAQKDYLKYNKRKIPTYGLPEEVHEEFYAVATQPEYYYTLKEELLAFDQSLEQTKKLGNLSDLPLLVIASKNSMDESVLPFKLKKYPFEQHNQIWLELQKELCNLSTNATYVESSQNHYLHVCDCDLVCNAIVDFIEKHFNEEK